ncbi:MAG TPA: TerB family tellurite resistance protein [Polyangiaceae bacterium]
MFGRWLRGEERSKQPSGGDALERAIAKELPGADAETIAVVTSMAGLLGAVAYADRNYSDAEEQRVRQELGRVHGMSTAGVDAICTALRQHVVELSTVQTPRYARTLVELGDVELRREVLGALIELAAADASISLAETNMLRQLTTALGLSQQDYVELQAQHRHHLEALKR